ncbi:MAG: hypothetical protein FD167_475 [bacterium]|nr:MAG: hypothetical protein FD167_475 [bacterium]
MKDIKEKQMDLQIDKALRNHLKHDSLEQTIKCEGFDPDLATAYAERTLAKLELKYYESHLADCKNCRQMTAEYMLLFADDLPAIEEVKEVQQVKSELVEREVAQVSKATKERGFSWVTVKEWLFSPQVRWAMAALLILFISGAVWMFSTNKTTSQTAGTEIKSSIEKNTQQPNNPTIDSSQTALNNSTSSVNPNPQPTPDNNLIKVPEQNQGRNKNNTTQIPIQNGVNNQEELEIANKENNPVKLPAIGKEDNLPDIANNKGATPLPIGDPLQVPPPPATDLAQNTEKNTPKDSTTNSGSPKSPRNSTDFGVGIVETVKEKKSVGGKTFLLKRGVWTDQEYVNSTKAKGLKKSELKKGSEDYQKALTANPVLRTYFELGTSVTVVYKDTVYIVK